MSALPRPPCPFALALAGVLATACSAPGPRPAEIPRTTPIVRIEVAPVTVAAVAAVAVEAPPATGPTILIDRAHDPNGVASGAAAAVNITVQRTLGRAGYVTAARGEAVDAEFLVTPTVHSLTVSPEGARTTISCRITLRISPWSTDDQLERWEAHSTASATGEARATTSSVRAQVELGMRDCLESAVQAAASRELIPFLRGSNPRVENISDSTSRAEL